MQSVQTGANDGDIIFVYIFDGPLFDWFLSKCENQSQALFSFLCQLSDSVGALLAETEGRRRAILAWLSNNTQLPKNYVCKIMLIGYKTFSF